MAVPSEQENTSDLSAWVCNHLEFVCNAPPEGLVWLSLSLTLINTIVSLALLPIVVGLFTTFVKWRSAKKANVEHDRKIERSIRDEFWFRKVVVPYCVNPLLDLYTDGIHQLWIRHEDYKEPGCDAKLFHKFMLTFIRNKFSVRQKLGLLRAVDVDVHDSLVNELLFLEDAVIMHCAHMDAKVPSTEERWTFEKTQKAFSDRLVQSYLLLEQLHVRVNEPYLKSDKNVKIISWIKGLSNKLRGVFS